MSFEIIMPLMIAGIVIAALIRKVDVYPELISGAREGVGTMLRVFPSLLILMFAVNMLKLSGAYDFLSRVMAPLLEAVKIPKEIAPLILIRPISGSGAVAVAVDLIATHGVDSLIGKTAAVMMGSTETTFYAISVYLGAVKAESTWKIVVSAVAADIIGFLTSAAAVRLFFT